MVQSMVPEVSLFFGDEDTTFGTAVQHPSSRPGGMVRPSSQQQQPLSMSTPLQTSGGQQSVTSVPNVSNISAQNRSVPVSVSNYLSNATCNPPSNTTVKSPKQQYVNSPSTQHETVSLGQQVQHPQISTATASHMPGIAATHQGFYGAPIASGPPPGMVRPPYCNCPSCPKPFPPQYYRSHSYEQVRGHGPTYPRHSYPNYGPPPPRLSAPQFSGYPVQHHQGINHSAAGIVSHSFPPPSVPDHQQLSGTPNQVVHSGTHTIPNAGIPVQNATNMPTGQMHTPAAPRTLPPVPAPVQSNVPSSYPSMVPTATPQQEKPQLNSRLSFPAPQTSGGLPIRSEERVTNVHSTSGESIQVNANGEVGRSNPSSDNSGRSSDDSGLSFTPEKHQTPPNPSHKAQNRAGPGPDGDLKSSIPTLNWENVPPEIYQLLMKQNEQLKQLQAQIEVLTAQSLNNTAESAVTAKSGSYPGMQKCTAATNTSAGFGEKEQISACMQTSQQDLVSSDNSSNPNQPAIEEREMTNSSGSGCETRTPLEIRHRGRLPMNSTQRDDGELDISQGELVALMNNMHDKTIDSVQSEMIVDLPSFQSSPSR